MGVDGFPTIIESLGVLVDFLNYHLLIELAA